MLLYKRINLKQSDGGNSEAFQQDYENKNNDLQNRVKNLQDQINELKDADPSNDEFKDVFTVRNVTESGQERATKFLSAELFKGLLDCSDDIFNNILNSINSLNQPTLSDEVKNDLWELKVLLDRVAKERSKKQKGHESIYNGVIQAVIEGRLNNIDDVLKKGGYENNMNNLLSYIKNDANYMDALYLIYTMKDKVDQNPFMKMSSRDKESYNIIFNEIKDKYDLNDGEIKELAKTRQLNLMMGDAKDSNGLLNLINKRLIVNDTWKGDDLTDDAVVFPNDGKNRLFNETDFIKEFNKRNRIRTENNLGIISGVQDFKFSDNFKIEENFKISDDGDKLMFKKGDKEGNLIFEEVTPENMLDIDRGMSFNLMDQLDYLDAEKGYLFKDLCNKFCDYVKGKLNQIDVSENSNVINCKLTPQDFENMKKDLGDTMFIEGSNDNVTYNKEKMMNFLGTIGKDNFREYWNYNRPKGNGKWRSLVSATQILLGNSKVDGRWTAKREIGTKIREFQKQEKLSGNGRLTFETFSKIIESKSSDFSTVSPDEDGTSSNQ